MLRFGHRVADDPTMPLPALRGLTALTVLALATSLAPVGPASAATTGSGERYQVPADGVFRMEGSGWGHGRGMSQWGAYQAATEGRSHTEILRFYYPGTTLDTLPSRDVRVLLASDTGRALVVKARSGLTFQEAGSAPRALPTSMSTCTARITRWRAVSRGSYMNLAAYCKGWRKLKRVNGSTLAFAQPGGLVLTKNGTVRRGYRGAVTAIQAGWRSVQVVNTLPMEQYLRAVVASEVSPSWPVESLRAQAIAARSYAAHEALGRASRSFDVYDGVQSQYYPGAVEYARRWKVLRYREDARTDAAIAATAGVHVIADGAPALTQFGSSNGGATAASPLSYMTAAADPWDARAKANPRRSWTDSVSASSLARWYPSLGPILAIRVLGREGAGPWGGRLTAIRIVGESGTKDVSGDSAIRSVLGTYSSMLTFTTG